MLLPQSMKRSHLYRMQSWAITAISGIWLRIFDKFQPAWHLLALLYQHSGILEIVNTGVVHVDNDVGFSSPDKFVVSFDLLRQIVILSGYDRQGVR
jgi:hypothetical protein